VPVGGSEAIGRPKRRRSERGHLARIRDKPIAPGSPWQNGFAERLIGSIRRECVDHIVVLGEAHLRGILTKYAAYYNELRTHRSPGKDAPTPRILCQSIPV
jgi:transposase InsO family protein